MGLFMSDEEIPIRLAKRMRDYLLFQIGKTVGDASDFDLYRAFCYAFRELLLVHWLATWKSYKKARVRVNYYFSMEYLPGRIGVSNVVNLHGQGLCEKTLQHLGLEPKNLLDYEPDPALGNGGLGRLASCFLESLSTQMYPAMGYGLRYQYGLFEQAIENGIQVERPDCWLLHENPWEFRRDLRAQKVVFGGFWNQTNEFVDYEEIRALPYDFPILGYSESKLHNVNTIRLWSTKESPSNFRIQQFNAGSLEHASENTALTDVLYPNDQHMFGKLFRIKQEFLLVSASLQDIFSRFKNTCGEDWSRFADMVSVHINDTHAALVIPEMIRLLQEEARIDFYQALDIVVHCTGYTNHTLLSEALEKWDQTLIHKLLPRQYRIIELLNHELCKQVREKFPQDEEKVQRLSMFQYGQVKMAHLAIFGSHRVNGVAKLHSELIQKELFKDFVDLYPERFCSITNGITQRRWLRFANPHLADLICKKIGGSWLYNSLDLEKLTQYADDPVFQDEFLKIKKLYKQNLLPEADPHALFDVQVKRIHEYKRQLLNLLHLIGLYLEVTRNGVKDRLKRVAIFAGKAASSYKLAKNIINLICAVSRKVNADLAAKDFLSIHFLPNYGVKLAEKIIPAADLSEQISLAGMEASGTGNMKLALNGALTIGTEDGANIEMRVAVGDEFWPFRFGQTSEEVKRLRSSGVYSPRNLLVDSPQLGNILSTLIDGTFASNQAETIAFREIYASLLEGSDPDRYLVLADFESYYQTQKKVEELFRKPREWARFALKQIAAMGSFSADISIKKYAQSIWRIAPCPIDPVVFQEVQKEY
ncbi:glycogen/starch/alpha-glucan family phosphorylase [Candidatus Similichlamydia laticola]|uniref:Alpha-1,4 glucan phosphorylase n=1 Tax=Candidatus Similichlamydia laticola TaxID=2170265 RepID=A0A369KJV7_9BACT|nr:glycogen/starch/alpha-glucan family phosphorylase [Candidatus Similichlamydia laticola]RDB31266.1 Glycogen phosphorylase [Candidatus Similichlamydia laticola]